MAFSESLTVRILGDSSELQRELDALLGRFDELKERISESSKAARQFSTSFGRLSQSIAPLQKVSNLIARVGQQIQAISQRPININVAPALQSLQQLTRAAQQTAAAIQSVSSLSSAGRTANPVSMNPAQPGLSSQAPRQLASGGLVTGPAGIDRVRTNLTSGEYVLRRSAVEVLGLGLLDHLNKAPGSFLQSRYLDSLNQRMVVSDSTTVPAISGAGPVPSLESSRPRFGVINPKVRQVERRSMFDTNSISPGAQTNNHFGGITIQVNSQVETESLFRNLQLQGIGRRIRRG